ncbi:MAG: hypothetical protein IH608_00745 [Proteobacteria bacterium]|nr:hypothetical protein [Pseudomonadota bacterium]
MNTRTGKGCEGLVSETCSPANPFQRLTAAAPQATNEGDEKALVPRVDP